MTTRLVPRWRLWGAVCPRCPGTLVAYATAARRWLGCKCCKHTQEEP